MGLKTDCYAKIWSAKPVGKTYSCNVSVSRRDKESGEYKTSFSGFITFAGMAAQKISELDLPENFERTNPRYESVKIKSSPDISTFFNKEKYDRLLAAAGGNQELVSFIKNNANTRSITIWDCEVQDSYGSSRSKNSPKQGTPSEQETPAEDDFEDDEELPFN